MYKCTHVQQHRKLMLKLQLDNSKKINFRNVNPFRCILVGSFSNDFMVLTQ